MELLVDEYITISRLNPSLKRSNNNLKKALAFYEINMAYSSELYKLLSILEISLRNSINKRCIELFGYNWITNIKYDIHLGMINRILKTTSATEKTRIEIEKIFSIQESIIEDTIGKLKEEHKPITSDYIISRTVFIFGLGYLIKLMRISYGIDL